MPAIVVLALIALAIAGFFPTYFGRFPEFVGTSAAIHFHVATLALWLGLALTQTILVRRRRVDLHRRLGRAAYALVPLMLVGFALAVFDGQQRQKNPALIVATLFDGGLFLAFVALGVWNRRRPDHHRRYMMLSLLPFLNPALGRLISPGVSIPLQFVILVALLISARRRGTLARPYAVGLGMFCVGLAGVMAMLQLRPEVPERLWLALFGG